MNPLNSSPIFINSLVISIFSIAFAVLVVFSAAPASAQRPGTHYDESKVPEFDLPDLLRCKNGNMIKTTDAWETVRRPEVFQMFADHVYGNVPDVDVPVSFEAGDSWEVLGGKGVRREIKMRIGKPENQVVATLLLTLPKSNTAAPCFLGFNFHGNHTTSDDPQITLPTSWVRNNNASHSDNHRATAKGRGSSASRWPCKEIINSGYGLCTIYYGDIDPDHDDQFKNGIHPLFYADGQKIPTRNEWGSIGAWAWSLTQIIDYFESAPDVDANRIAVIGHSRLGKTALWAGAMDPRFSLVISNDSGCGGAALSRRGFGETVKVINTNFPHWFCDQFTEYNGQENKLPIDQHMLIALIAPRAVYVASASGDPWADPKGEFLAIAGADTVYQLYGNQTMTSDWPQPDSPLWVGPRAYHLRTGKHDITLYDWQQYLRFADQQMGSRPE